LNGFWRCLPGPSVRLFVASIFLSAATTRQCRGAYAVDLIRDADVSNAQRSIWPLILRAAGLNPNNVRILVVKMAG
jgi:hypothetical protein